MKRFAVRKVKQHAYSRQGWILEDKGYVFVVYDHEWKKNLDEAFAWCNSSTCSNWKYIDTAYSKEVAQFRADWLNEHCSNSYGHKITIPNDVFAESMKLYSK